MPDLVSSSPPPNKSAADTTLAAAIIQGAQVRLKAGYSALLNEMIFSRPPSGVDRKEVAALRRILDNDEAHSILALIWQATDAVSRYPSVASGIREECGHLTCYGLAVKLAILPEHVSKMNSRVRHIGIAATRYGLIQRQGVHANKVHLIGTPLLHEFFLKLSQDNLCILRELRPLIEEPPASVESSPNLVVRRGKK